MHYDELEDDDGFIRDRLEEARADQDDAPPPGPIPLREVRRRDADRKRIERARRRASGRVEQALLDGAIVTAIANLFREHDVPGTVARRGSLKGVSLEMGALCEEAGAILRAKGATDDGIRAMLGERLLGLIEAPERSDASL